MQKTACETGELQPEREAQPRLLQQALQREILLLRSWTQLLARDWKKYLWITSVIHLSDLLGVSRGMRPAYHFCRKIDDAVDGDNVPESPDRTSEQIESLLQQVEGNCGNASDESRLMEHALHSLPHTQEPGEAQRLLATFLHVMQDDCRRRMHCVLFSKQELDRHYERSFGCVHDLALIALNARTRSIDLSPLALLQGRIYGQRDLEKEFPRGEINIPREVVEESGLAPATFLACPSPTRLPAVQQWKRRECAWAVHALHYLERMSCEKKVRMMLTVLLSPLRRIINEELEAMEKT